MIVKRKISTIEETSIKDLWLNVYKRQEREKIVEHYVKNYRMLRSQVESVIDQIEKEMAG